MGLLAVAESSVSIILSFDITKCNKLLTGPFPKYIYILLQTYIGHCGKNSPGEQFVVFWQRVYQKTHAAFSHVIFFPSITRDCFKMDKKNKIMLETSFWFYNCICLKYNL